MSFTTVPVPILRPAGNPIKHYLQETDVVLDY